MRLVPQRGMQGGNNNKITEIMNLDMQLQLSILTGLHKYSFYYRLTYFSKGEKTVILWAI